MDRYPINTGSKKDLLNQIDSGLRFRSECGSHFFATGVHHTILIRFSVGKFEQAYLGQYHFSWIQQVNRNGVVALGGGAKRGFEFLIHEVAHE